MISHRYRNRNSFGNSDRSGDCGYRNCADSVTATITVTFTRTETSTESVSAVRELAGTGTVSGSLTGAGTAELGQYCSNLVGEGTGVESGTALRLWMYDIRNYVNRYEFQLQFRI